VSRDNARTPVQWDASASAGFTTGTPWLPVNPDYRRWNADAQRRDEGSVLAHYRRLIALRHRLPVVALGDFTMLLPDHPAVYAFSRRLAEPAPDELLVVCNVSGDEVDLADLLPQALAAREVVLSNVPAEAPEDVLRRAVLRPWEARVLRAG
jgi:oligo-1,6-glucosidase